MRSTFWVATCAVFFAMVHPAIIFAAGSGGWSVQVEPASANAAVESGKVRLALQVDFPNSLGVAWPCQPGPLIPVAIVSSGGDCKWNVLDLRTGKSTPAAETGKLDNVFASREGKYIAGRGSNSGYECQVWSLSEKKKVLGLKAQGAFLPWALAFRGEKNLLLSHIANAEKETFTETDLTSGKTVRSYTLPLTMREEGWAISPGGKYLAVLSQYRTAQSIYLCDLDAGKVVASKPVPMGEHGSKHIGFPAATAFSDDGSKVAVLFTTGVTYRLIQWSVATGKVERDLPNIKVAVDFPNTEQGPLLQFVPGGKVFRLSHFLLDWETGAVVDSVPMPSGQSGKLALVQMISANKAIVATVPTMQNPSTILATERVGE